MHVSNAASIRLMSAPLSMPECTAANCQALPGYRHDVSETTGLSLPLLAADPGQWARADVNARVEGTTPR